MIEYRIFLRDTFFPVMSFITVILFAFFVFSQTQMLLPMFIIEIFVVMLLPFGYLHQTSNLYIKNEATRIIFLMLTSILYIIGFLKLLDFINVNQIDWYVPIATETVVLLISISVVPVVLLILSFPFKIIDMYISGTKRLYYKYGINDAIQDNELIEVENDKHTKNYITGGEPFFWQSSKTITIKRNNISYIDIEVNHLKKILKEKVEKEEYEEAAKIRDIIYKKEKR
ncbi:MAG: hypothetical protein ACOCVF_02240 [bacterium]